MSDPNGREAPDDATRRELMRSLIAEARRTGAYPEAVRFRIDHEKQRRLLDEMETAQWIRREGDRYRPTLLGLRTVDTEETRGELERASRLLPLVQAAFRRDPAAVVDAADFTGALGASAEEVQRAMLSLGDLRAWQDAKIDPGTGHRRALRIAESVLDITPIELAPVSELKTAWGEAATVGAGRLARVEIAGYRPFREFTAELGDLTVIIGANATGKSSLFDFLRMIGRFAQEPIPPGIDEQAPGPTLFHLGGPERIGFGFTIDLGGRIPVHYSAEILGPIGAPKVGRERLASASPLREGETEPFVFMDFAGGRGSVRGLLDAVQPRPPWTLPPNELAIRRALDPTLVTPPVVQAFLASWQFYSGYEMASRRAVRQPAPTEAEPVLRPDGGNLSAVLLWLSTATEAWDELESQLRAVVPGFRALQVRPYGGPGQVMALWREDGLPQPLTLGDLSDGTLRFLCWAALCLSPRLPPLLCIDEPELGLHPRALPALAGLLRLASARTRILVTTHSPYLLSQFPLEDIAVMRKRDGAAELVRPSDSAALREMVAELGGEALARLHLSDELETLP